MAITRNKGNNPLEFSTVTDIAWFLPFKCTHRRWSVAGPITESAKGLALCSRSKNTQRLKVKLIKTGKSAFQHYIT